MSILLTGGHVLDGLGTPAYRADVRITGDRIESVETDPHGPAPGDVVLDVTGRVVCPGFIDMHSHSDIQLLAEPAHEAKLLQGVTTEVLGQDGLSYAPVDDAVLARLRAQIKGWNDDPPGFDWDWRTVAQYLERIDGAAVNVAYLVPHGTLRLMVVGGDARPATDAEIDQMCALLDQALADGAVGMSAGLTYVPAMYATTDELIALCRVVAGRSGYFCPHHRNYGSHVIDGYRECVDIARASGVALHLAHTHMSFPANRDRLSELLGLLAQAVADGVDLTFDSYPYLAGMSTLHAQLPSWALAGDLPEQLARLEDPATRREIVRALDETGSDGHQGFTVDWATITVSAVPGAPQYDWLVGQDLASAAAQVSAEPAELCLDIIRATNLGASGLMNIGIEDHVRVLMQHPAHTVGSDGILVGRRPHPRGWGTFARMLGQYVRVQGVLELAECVRHMTSTPAARIGATDRGQLRPGAYADVVVLDPAIVADQSTYDEPRRPPVGIDHVVVNGELAVRDGAVTGAHAGRALRRATGVSEEVALA